MLSSALILAACTVASAKTPPNEAAKLTYSKGIIELNYNGKVIFSGSLDIDGKPYIRKVTQKGDQGQVDQVFAISAKSVKLSGHISADSDSFACSSEPEGYDATRVVRHTYGKGTNTLNRAVYERSSDWLLSVDQESDVTVQPAASGYGLSVVGREIILRFRPRFYSVHRGLKYFEPWNRKAWTRSEVGWCSWFAFWDRVKQEDIHDAAKTLNEKLLPYGLDTLQIDDGFQQAPVGLPETWIKPNEKFPDGMAALAKFIRSQGLIPGIWLTPMVHREEAVTSHPDLFVKGEDGKPVKAPWIGYPIDGSNPKAIDTFTRPVFADYAKNGWAYFKMDALRHLRYEGYNSQAGFFKKKKADRVEAFRNVVRAAREEIGADKFLMACWGPRPELASIVDAVRIGGDGFGWECMAQYNSFNNVVWRNDPDHIEATHANGYLDCTITSLTGSLFMLTDKPEDIRTKDLSAVKATIPVLFTTPGQVYDVDPSHSVHLNLVDSELSGSGPRPFDASRSTGVNLFQLDINTDWANWSLLARTREQEKSIKFADLGLKGKKYLVFEFWTKKLLGQFEGEFQPGAINEKYKVQLFCIREVVDHPFVVATSRHISCGALDLHDVKWDGQLLKGTCDRVINDPVTIFIYDPSKGSLAEINLPAGTDKQTPFEYR